MTTQPNQPEDIEPRTTREAMEQKILAVNMLKDYKYTPKNVVLVTVDDIIEIMHEVYPYSLSKLTEALELEAEATRREHAAEIRGAYFAASSILLEMSPLLVHRTEMGFPEMTAEVIGKTYEAVKKEMQPYQAKRQALTEKEL